MLNQDYALHPDPIATPFHLTIQNVPHLVIIHKSNDPRLSFELQYEDLQITTLDFTDDQEYTLFLIRYAEYFG